MPKRERRRTGQFTARDDSGKTYTIYIYTHYISVDTRDDPDGMIEGLKELVLIDGSHINRKDKGVYEIVGSGTIIRSDDPSAP